MGVVSDRVHYVSSTRPSHNAKGIPVKPHRVSSAAPQLTPSCPEHRPRPGRCPILQRCGPFPDRWSVSRNGPSPPSVPRPAPTRDRTEHAERPYPVATADRPRPRRHSRPPPSRVTARPGPEQPARTRVRGTTILAEPRTNRRALHRRAGSVRASPGVAGGRVRRHGRRRVVRAAAGAAGPRGLRTQRGQALGLR